jgi:hypothetical protein
MNHEHENIGSSMSLASSICLKSIFFKTYSALQFAFSVQDDDAIGGTNVLGKRTVREVYGDALCWSGYLIIY